MATKNENITPFMAVHPGSILKEELKERNIKQKDFAKTIGMQPTHLNSLIHGYRPISAGVADRLEEQLGISSISWQNLQTQFNHDVKIINERDAEEQKAIKKLQYLNDHVSVNTLVKRLKIKYSTKKEELNLLEEAIGNHSAEKLQFSLSSLFRRSEKTGLDNQMINTWVLLANIYAKSLSVKGKYNSKESNSLTTDLVKIFNENSNTVKKLTNRFSQSGIKFGVVEKVDKASIDGYSFMDGKTPCIIVTMRYNRIDSLAFSVMHELCHVMNHLSDDKEKHFLDLDFHTPDSDCTGYSKCSREESEADKFAVNAIIPEELWRKSPETKANAYILQKAFTNWAEEIHYNKWLVLGRVCHELGMWRLKDDGSRKVR